MHGRLPVAPIYVTGRSHFFVPSEVPSQAPSEETREETSLGLTSPVQVTDPTPVFASGSGTSHKTELLSLTDPSLRHEQLVPRPSYDALQNQEIKVLFCGDQRTGRTSLIRQIINSEYSCQYNRTVSFDNLCVICVGNRCS